MGEWCNSKNVVYVVHIPMEHNDGERVYIGISAGIGNKVCIITDILSPISELKTKPLYLDILEP